MVDLSLHLMDIMQNSVVVDSTYVEVRICAEKKKNLNRKKKEHLFWNRSADGRIRKHYRKKVLEKLKGSPDSAWTPTQTAGHMELEDADAKVFAQIYEKARYAGTSCTKEEMEKMLRIR